MIVLLLTVATKHQDQIDPLPPVKIQHHQAWSKEWVYAKKRVFFGPQDISYLYKQTIQKNKQKSSSLLLRDGKQTGTDTASTSSTQFDE
jgi:hypothetical protein